MSPPDRGVDEAVEQVNQAVDDGGGCAEAWEALSDLRENRRGFLKEVGKVGSAAALISAGASSIVAGEEQKASLTKAKAAFHSSEVQALHTELGSPEVRLNESTIQSATADDLEIELTTIPSTFGDFVYSSNDQSGTSAQHHFDTGPRNNLPTKYRSATKDEQAVLTTTEDGLVSLEAQQKMKKMN